MRPNILSVNTKHFRTIAPNVEWVIPKQKSSFLETGAKKCIFGFTCMSPFLEIYIHGCFLAGRFEII
ncbi:MAG: hypothetical protein DRP93_05050 [Candidatus Neomarinimicrobiota bacterium]|nr:MAG: hypothetical protein DRP93_05050 [Candidatus Neomarinimicrobiota bacterium]